MASPRAPGRAPGPRRSRLRGGPGEAGGGRPPGQALLPPAGGTPWLRGPGRGEEPGTGRPEGGGRAPGGRGGPRAAARRRLPPPPAAPAASGSGRAAEEGGEEGGRGGESGGASGRAGRGARRLGDVHASPRKSPGCRRSSRSEGGSAAGGTPLRAGSAAGPGGAAQESRPVSPRGRGAAPALPPCPGPARSRRRRGLPSPRAPRSPPRPPSAAPLPPCTAAPAPLRCGRSAAVPPLGARAAPRKQSSPCREWAFNSPAHQGELAEKKKKKKKKEIHPATPQARPLSAPLPARSRREPWPPVVCRCSQGAPSLGEAAPSPVAPRPPAARAHARGSAPATAPSGVAAVAAGSREPRGTRGSPVGHKGAPWVLCNRLVGSKCRALFLQSGHCHVKIRCQLGMG
ncbi:uncharacterized protein [Anas platyrhynchos]|uniref:uncharacterized protein n=1 Tax=Anas platyrhynchos TaxID=8839 RepID=UPI003AF266C8